MPPREAANRLSTRDVSLDVARGIAMILVVAAHSIRGLSAAGLGDKALIGVLDKFLYLAALPVFAVAVGMLTPGSVERAGWRPYLRRRLTLLAYLYLLWTLLQGTVEVLTTPWKNRPVGWGDVVAIWVPIGHLWFLPHLAVATVVLVVVAPWRPGLRAAIGGAAVAAVSLASWGWEPIWIGLGGVGLLVWYVAGAAIGATRFSRWAGSARTPALLVVWAVSILGVVGIVLSLPVTTPTTQSVRTVPSVAAGVLGVILAAAGSFALAAAWARSRTSAWLAYVGRQSLAVYLGHIVVTSGTRVLLVRLGVTGVAPHLLSATVLGVVLPLLLERVTRPVPYLFVPPWVRRPPRTTAAP